MMKRIVETVLRNMAKVLLRKYRPLIVGITGSVGKSSTKEVVGLVLARKYRVRMAEGNYNNEIGIPLTIIGAKSGGRSPVRWAMVVGTWLSFFVFPRRYPEVLVLEMGIDRPGDMAYLLSFVPVTVGIFTQVSESHALYFGSLGNIAKEKGKLVTSLPVSGYAILNVDDVRVMRFRDKTKAKVVTFGFGEGADIRAENVSVEPEARLVKGITFKMNYRGKSLPVRLPKVVARHHLPAVLAAAATGVALRVNPVEIVDALSGFEPLPGRMRLLPGKHGSIVLDDTYNASPVSTKAALSVFKELSAERKIVVLGDMLELGDDAQMQHSTLCDPLVASGAEYAILVGWHMRHLYESLLKYGFASERAMWFERSDEAAHFVESLVRDGDLILVKGSQGMRMEWVSEKLLFDSAEAPFFLCRQSAEWKRKPLTIPTEWGVG